MNMPPYIEFSDFWKVEGSLRDIYILHTELTDWEKLIEFASGYPYTYMFDGTHRDLPKAADIFANREGGHLLYFDLGLTKAFCHFFVMSEIEFDLDPREIQSSEAHFEVMHFIECLANAVGKIALLTPENAEEIPHVSYEPGTKEWRVYESRI